MGKIYISGGGGADVSDVTATTAEVLSGYNFTNADGDLVGGALSLSGNASAGDVLKDKTFYNNNAKTKVTGTLALSGNASAGDVLKDKTFYNTDAKTKVTGTLALSGNASVGDVLSGKTFYNTDAKTKVTGTLSLSGNATANMVLKDKTFYNTDAKTKVTGTMVVGTLGSFSCASYSTTQITCTWTNPSYNPKNGVCFSGVVIRYKTGSYPTSPTDGTLGYMGAGSNNQYAGISSTIIGGLSNNTTYYFSCYPYFVCSAGNYTVNNTTIMVGTVKQATKATSNAYWVSVTSSNSSYKLPDGYALMDIYLVGGGAGGRTSTSYWQRNYWNGSHVGLSSGSGGGSGYTKTQTNVNISSVKTCAITIGSGGGTNTAGGQTKLVHNGTTYSADGGKVGTNAVTEDLGYSEAIKRKSESSGGAGGCAGGKGAWLVGRDVAGTTQANYGYSSAGANGANSSFTVNGTTYGGGGGAGKAYYIQHNNQNNKGSIGQYSGGTPSGGAGGETGGTKTTDISASVGKSASANTGGGGGGGGVATAIYYLGGSDDYKEYNYAVTKTANGGSGGSGIVRIYFH